MDVSVLNRLSFKRGCDSYVECVAADQLFGRVLGLNAGEHLPQDGTAPICGDDENGTSLSLSPLCIFTYQAQFLRYPDADAARACHPPLPPPLRSSPLEYPAVSNY